MSLLLQETRHQQGRLLEDTSKTALLLEGGWLTLIFAGSPVVYEDILSSWELVCGFRGLCKAPGKWGGGDITWWLVTKVWAEDAPP